MGEVPIGVLLSGGVDSSAIACYVSALGADLTTFNIGFPDLNEFEFSREVASALGLKHREILVTVEELIAKFDLVLEALDEPIADPACFPLYALSEELKKHVTVVLSGEGGDELFAGYPQYKSTMDRGFSATNRFESFLAASHYFPDPQRYLLDPSIPPYNLRFGKYFEENSLLNGMLAYDMRTWMPENLMMKADKIMMMHSLEGRFPFLDRDLFEFSTRLPTGMKLAKDGTTKWILKELMRSKLPSSIISRPKMGFSVPVSNFLKILQSRVCDAIATAKRSALADILNIETFESEVRDYYERGQGSALRIWTNFVMLEWFGRKTALNMQG
jgi:asparagine synthase (glutamine-hydrolysing)